MVAGFKTNGQFIPSWRMPLAWSNWGNLFKVGIIMYVVNYDYCGDRCEESFDTINDAIVFINELLKTETPFDEIKLGEYNPIKLEPIDVVKSVKVVR